MRPRLLAAVVALFSALALNTGVVLAAKRPWWDPTIDPYSIRGLQTPETGSGATAGAADEKGQNSAGGTSTPNQFDPATFNVSDGQCRFGLTPSAIGDWFDCKIRQTAAAIYRSLEDAVVFIPAMFTAAVLKSANALVALPGPLRNASYGDWLLRTWSVAMYLAIGIFAFGMLWTAYRLFVPAKGETEGPVDAGRRFVGLILGVAMAYSSFAAMDYLTLVAQKATVSTTEESCPWKGQVFTVEVPGDGNGAPATATVNGDELCSTEWVKPQWPVLTYLASWAPPVGPGGAVFAGSAPNAAVLAFARNLLDGCDQAQRPCPGGQSVPPGGLGWTLLVLGALQVLGLIGAFWQVFRIFLVGAGPLYCMAAVVSRNNDGLWGYWHLVLRTILVPIPVLALLAAARAAAGPAADIVSPVVVSFGALLVLDVLLILKYVWPSIVAVRTSPVTLAGGTVRAKVQEWGARARAVVEGLGIATGRPGLVRAARAPGQAAAAVGGAIEKVADAGQAVADRLRRPAEIMRRSVEAAADPRAALEQVRERANDPVRGWFASSRVERNGLYHAAFPNIPSEVVQKAHRTLSLHGLKADWHESEDGRRVLVVPLKAGDQAAEILRAELDYMPYWTYKGQYVVLREDGPQLSPEPPEDGVSMGDWGS